MASELKLHKIQLSEALEGEKQLVLEWARAHGYQGGFSGPRFRSWLNEKTGANIPNMPIREYIPVALAAVRKREMSSREEL